MDVVVEPNKRRLEELNRYQQIVNDIDAGQNKADVASKYRIKFSQICKIYSEYGKRKTEERNEMSYNRDEKIAKLYLEGMAAKDIAKAIGLKSTQSVYNVLDKMGAERKRGKCKKTTISDDTKKKESVGYRDNWLVESFLPRPIIEVGLIADRHEMPTNQFIFKTPLSSAMMFDYDLLDQTVEDFVQDNLSFKKNKDGVTYSREVLVVYVTGLTCCLASLIKVCDRLHVDLTLKHYNNTTGGYYSQVVYNNFGVSSVMQNVFEQASKVIYVGCKPEDFVTGAKYYATKIINFSSTKSKTSGMRYCEEYVSFNKGDMWVTFVQESQKALDDSSTDKLAVYFQENEISNKNTESLVRLISKTSNFRFYKK